LLGRLCGRLADQNRIASLTKGSAYFRTSVIRRGRSGSAASDSTADRGVAVRAAKDAVMFRVASMTEGR
jgi:hypothetical protein